MSFRSFKKWSRRTSLIITILKFNIVKILAGAKRKERCDHLFELFQEVADGWKQEKETTIDEDAREATSAQGFATNQTRWKKDRLREISEDELSTANKDVRASATTTGPTKEWKPLTTPRPGQNAGRKTNPAKQAPISLGGVSVTNHGSGTVTTSLRDSGYMGSINSNVGNNDSKNHFRPTGRPKKEKVLPVTISGFDIENYGSGNVGNENSRWNRPLVVENYGSGYVGSENFDHSNVIPRPGVWIFL